VPCSGLHSLSEIMTIHSGSGRHLERAVFRRQGRARSTEALVGLVLLAALVLGCGGSDRSSLQPQTRQPERPRSASDGEVIGANGQAPEDTLEGSLTNEHPPPGWVVENGHLVRETEVQKAGERSEPKDPKSAKRDEDCVADSQQEAASEAKAKSDAAGRETEPAPRALKRSLKPGCPEPVKH
jgi:hypothetical protein